MKFAGLLLMASMAHKFICASELNQWCVIIAYHIIGFFDNISLETKDS